MTARTTTTTLVVSKGIIRCSIVTDDALPPAAYATVAALSEDIRRHTNDLFDLLGAPKPPGDQEPLTTVLVDYDAEIEEGENFT